MKLFVLLLLLCALWVHPLKLFRQKNRVLEFTSKTFDDLERGKEEPPHGQNEDQLDGQLELNGQLEEQVDVQLEEQLNGQLELNSADPDQGSEPTSGVWTGRIQLVSTTLDFRCLARSQTPTNMSYLSLEACSYASNQQFVYDATLKTLTTQDGTGNNFAVKNISGIVPAGPEPVVLRPNSAVEDYEEWHIKFGDFFGIRIQGPADSKCLQVGLDEAKPIVTAVKLNTNGTGDRCSRFKFMLLEADHVAGQIRLFSNKDTDDNHCVTFNSTASPPQSVLYAAPCQTGLSTQRFVYNFISKHLRTAYQVTAPATPINQSALFFWWSGAIKQYPNQITFDTPGYGWTLPMLRVGNVIMNDERYYSGKCWRLSDNQIVANQTNCGLFSFKPERLPFFLLGVAPPTRKYSTVQITIPSNPTQCATLAKMPDLNSYNLQLQMKDCAEVQTYNIGTRMVLSQLTDATCTTTACSGHLHWAGELDRIMLPSNSQYFNFSAHSRQIIFHPLTEDMVPYSFNLPYRRLGYINATYQGYTACVGVDSNNLLIMTDNPSQCVKFFVRPANVSITGMDMDQPGVTVLERFDRRATWLFENPKDPDIGDATTLRQAVQMGRGLSLADQNKFQRIFDAFVADLGGSGVFRFAFTGLGSRLTPWGDLVANLDNQSGGIAFPLQLPNNVNSFLIDFYFSVVSSSLDGSKQGSGYMLMSFVGTSGCVLYVTFAGGLGIRCYREDAVGSAQVKYWPSPAFSLLDGKTHQVALLYTTQASQNISVFVDGRKVLSITAHDDSDMDNIASAASFFYDPSLWQYTPLPGALQRVSIFTGSSISSLTTQATTLALNVSRLPGDINQLTRVGNIQTRWTNCVFARRVDYPLYDSMSCTLTAVDGNNNNITLPMDVFSLGCSRPHCQIYFAPGQSQLQSSYTLVYKPNFPGTFMSEDVGNPDTFTDKAFVTDGFRVYTTEFDLKYNKPNSNLEVGVAINTQYTAVESHSPTQPPTERHDETTYIEQP
eukprot:TRINITY_DN4248_c0_g1_i7.p1 TRINITY_DN4248_c0_g1~~TRINITY_DN4248_c0_g1_i7.p1  ORF type:complete len:1002 (+),score=199.18 TRINITY_DN4248_c0_g1_i7:78-3083(+)